jgi:hypothetical protein
MLVLSVTTIRIRWKVILGGNTLLVEPMMEIGCSSFSLIFEWQSSDFRTDLCKEARNGEIELVLQLNL